MVYLVATQDKRFIKIGYSSYEDSSIRFTSLQAGTPDTLELLNTREGILNDEQYLHLLCDSYRYRGEWYYYNEEVIDIFNNADLSPETSEKRIIEVKNFKYKRNRLKFFKEDGTKRYDNIPYIKDLLSEMVIKGYANMWVYHTFTTNTPLIYKSDLEFMADKLGYAKGWVSYKMVELAGKVINDLQSTKIKENIINNKNLIGIVSDSRVNAIHYGVELGISDNKNTYYLVTPEHFVSKRFDTIYVDPKCVLSDKMKQQLLLQGELKKRY